MMPIDSIDKKILEILQQDSRTQYRDIANQVKVSLGTVSNRIQKLQELGIIRGWTLSVDPEKVGIDLTTIIKLSINVKYLDTINAEITKIPELVAVYNVTGDNDIIAIGRFADRRHLDSIIHRIINIDHINKTSSSIVLRTLKENLSQDLGHIKEK